jgi:cell division septation protein DedD
MKVWIRWWKANEGRVDERIREINPGYYPPPPVTASASTPSATPKPVVIGEYAATPAITNTPKPTPSATPFAAAPAQRSGWVIYVVGSFIALCAVGAVIWAVRKRK